MRKYSFITFVFALLFPFLFSCVAMPPVEHVPVPELVQPVQPEKPVPSANIMGNGMVDGEKLSLFIQYNNPAADMDYVRSLAAHYINEAAFEGISHDVAFIQMCLETGFLRFGGDVSPLQYNYCGLGAVGNGEPGLSFPDPQTGVRAHVQHLKGYATGEPLKGELVDPRYKWVRKGSSPTIEGLAGTWAADRTYSVKLNDILNRLYDFSF